MDLANKPDTNEYVLFSEPTRVHGVYISEFDFERQKLSYNPILSLVGDLIKSRMQICSLHKDIKQAFADFDDYTNQCAEFEIELSQQTREGRNKIFDSFVYDDAVSQDIVEELDEQIEGIFNLCEDFKKESLEKLRECLQKNLPEFPETTINSLFATSDVYDILGFFESDEEFLSLANEKEKNFHNMSSMQAYTCLAKAVAVKVVSPVLTGDERKKAIKKNLDQIKPCLKGIGTALKEFESENTFEITSEQAEIIANLTKAKSAIEALMETNNKRLIAEKIRSKGIDNKAKEPAASRPETGMDEPLNASRIMHRGK